ncbi:energy transducer TonB [bacterium]|nr:energy transducer TonB [bacterium]
MKKRTNTLRSQYKRVMELGLILSLLLHIGVMQGYKKLASSKEAKVVQLESLTVEEIPQTQQERQAPAPSRPSVPVASEDEDLPDDETIDFTDLDLDAEPPPPPPPPEEDDGSQIMFYAYDEPPQPIGGWSALKKNLIYPDIAQKAGVEGTVSVYAHIDTDGSVLGTRVIQSLTGCDQAAVTAVTKTKWKPAMQRDQPVKVWVMVPVIFKLK